MHTHRYRYILHTSCTNIIHTYIFFIGGLFFFHLLLSCLSYQVVKVPRIFWIQNHLSDMYPAIILSQFMVWLVIFLTAMFKEQKFLIVMKSTFKYFILCTLCILSKKNFALSRVTRSPPVFFYKSYSFAFWWSFLFCNSTSSCQHHLCISLFNFLFSCDV